MDLMIDSVCVGPFAMKRRSESFVRSLSRVSGSGGSNHAMHGSQLMVRSSILGRQTSDSKVEDLPDFLQHFLEARPLFVFIFRNSESRPRAVMTLSTKWLRLWRDLFSLCLYHVGDFNVDFSYTLDDIATLFWSPIYALHGLGVRAIQCKVLFFVFGLVC